jgi:hypothetical protein
LITLSRGAGIALPTPLTLCQTASLSSCMLAWSSSSKLCLAIAGGTLGELTCVRMLSSGMITSYGVKSGSSAKELNIGVADASN